MSHFKGEDVGKGLPRFQPRTSVLKLLEDCLRKNGQNTALIEGETDRSTTFIELLHQSTYIAAGLQRVGVAEGDVVAICCEKSVIAYSALLGTIFTGATALFIPTQHAGDFHLLTKNHHVKAVFVDAIYKDSTAKAIIHMTPPPSMVVTLDTDDPVMSTLLTPTEHFSVYEVKEIWKHVSVVLFTRGTTGVPKGLQITDIGVQLSGLQFSHICKTILFAYPFFWYTSIFVFMSSIFNNYTIILGNSLEPKHNLQLIEKYQVDSWLLNSSYIHQYNIEPSLDHFDLSSVTQVVVGGEVLLKSVLNTFVTKVLGSRVKLEIRFGIAECGLVTTCIYTSPYDGVKTGICGKVNPGVETKIVGDDGEMLAPGCVGELRIKSTARITGYWNRPELNGEVFDKDGFYQTGDGGFFDEDGTLYLRGRICDFINYKGNKFSSPEVVDILMSHPAVLDAAVVGTPHPTDVQHPTAYVVKISGSNVTEKEISDFVEGHIPDHKKLRGGVHFVNKVPRGMWLNTVDKKVLKD